MFAMIRPRKIARCLQRPDCPLPSDRIRTDLTLFAIAAIACAGLLALAKYLGGGRLAPRPSPMALRAEGSRSDLAAPPWA